MSNNSIGGPHSRDSRIPSISEKTQSSTIGSAGGHKIEPVDPGTSSLVIYHPNADIGGHHSGELRDRISRPLTYEDTDKLRDFTAKTLKEHGIEGRSIFLKRLKGTRLEPDQEAQILYLVAVVCGPGAPIQKEGGKNVLGDTIEGVKLAAVEALSSLGISFNDKTIILKEKEGIAYQPDKLRDALKASKYDAWRQGVSDEKPESEVIFLDTEGKAYSRRDLDLSIQTQRILINNFFIMQLYNNNSTPAQEQVEKQQEERHKESEISHMKMTQQQSEVFVTGIRNKIGSLIREVRLKKNEVLMQLSKKPSPPQKTQSDLDLKKEALANDFLLSKLDETQFDTFFEKYKQLDEEMTKLVNETDTDNMDDTSKKIEEMLQEHFDKRLKPFLMVAFTTAGSPVTEDQSPDFLGIGVTPSRAAGAGG